MMTDKLQGIYFGDRGVRFKDFLKNILKKTGVGKDLITILTEDSSMLIYNNAFTSDSVDMDDNYQILEQIGDLSGNKFISNYMYERFPVLDRTEAVQVVARLRINYGAKESFSEFARSLGFFEFITATNELRKSNMKDLLEDVFEAFLGATERILDRRKRVGVGYAVVYDILATIFDNIEISLRYEDMYDPKTRLKELLEKDKKAYGKEQYRNVRTDNLVRSEVVQILNGVETVIGVGVASLQTPAEEKAAQMALETLAKQGIFKPLPNIFRIINSEYYNDKEKDKEEIITSKMILQELEKAQIKQDEYSEKNGLEKKKLDINSSIFVKQKTKHSFRYETPLLALYCKSRNLSGVVQCLKLGANHNTPDINGVYPLDLLIIGKHDDEISKIISVLIKSEKTPLKIHNSVFDLYYTKYLVNEEFKKYIDYFEIVKD
jgi:dsRNA-specific ribonuclease